MRYSVLFTGLLTVLLWAETAVALPSLLQLHNFNHYKTLAAPSATTAGNPRLAVRPLVEDAGDVQASSKQSLAWLRDMLSNVQTILKLDVDEDADDLDDSASHVPVNLDQYENEVVLRFEFETMEEQQTFRHACDTLVLDVWNLDARSGDVRIEQSRVKYLLRLLPSSLRAPSRHSELISDVQMAVFASYPMEVSLDKTQGPSNPRAFFTDYRSLADVNTYIDYLAGAYGPDLVRVKSAGLSAEGVPIHAVHIGTVTSAPKPRVVVVAGVEGREWLAVMSALRAISDILAGPRELLKTFEFVFIPVLNPDGYRYTWQGDRLWRKNRQRTALSICPGIDLDHAFSTAWSASSTCCSPSYSGLRALDAVEAVAISQYLDQMEGIAGYLQLSSYAPRIVFSDAAFSSDTPLLASQLASVLKDATEDFDDVSVANLSDTRDGSYGGSLVDEMHARGATAIVVGMPSYNSGYLTPKKHIDEATSHVSTLIANFCEML